jgi:type I restriction-modification system DNA methylase subunit
MEADISHINLIQYFDNYKLSILTTLCNICCYCYIIKMYSIIDYQENIYDLFYNETNKNNLLNQIKKKFNFDIQILDITELNNIIIFYNKNNNIVNLIINYLIKNKNFGEYFTNRQLIKYIVEMATPTNEKILNLCSGTGGFIIELINNYKLSDLTKIDCFDINEQIKIISVINIFLNTSIMVNINTNDIIYENVVNKTYDLILCDFPSGIHNIIHANCCNKIKNLKIRGTKADPLILQLIFTSLNPNGRACIIVPDSLLYNESKQHIDTRKYLFNNFNILKIVSIDSCYQSIKGYKSSILYLKKNGKTNNVIFSNIINENNNIKETPSNTISGTKISNNKYILYHNKYIDINDNEKITGTKMFKDIAYFIDSNSNISEILTEKLNGNYISLSSHLNDQCKHNIILNFTKFNLEKDKYSIIVKDETVCLQRYINYYIYQILQNKLAIFTKGKLKKLDIDSFDFEIVIPSIKNQQIIINYFDVNYKLIGQNTQQINLYKKLISEYINLYIYNCDKIKLKNICTIDNKPEQTNTISIQRNSISGGTVFLSTDESTESINIYYLVKVNSSYINKFLYYILKNYEPKLIELAHLTSSINLNKTNLENFEIPNLPLNIQEQIIQQCSVYENICNNLQEINQTILSKNIIQQINKLENNNQ